MCDGTRLPLVIKILLLSLISSLPAGATSYGKPKRQLIYSPNGEFVLAVNPETERHIIKAASEPETEIWSFSRRVWHFPFFLSNDGQTAAVVEWRHVRKESLAERDCVTFYQADGSEKGIPFEDVYPSPPRTSLVTIGPAGYFWRTWYHDVEKNGDLFTIATTGGGSATFDLNERALVKKSWIGYRKPMNLLTGICVIVLTMVAFGIRGRRLRKRLNQIPSRREPVNP